MFGVGVGIRVGGFTPSGGIDAQAQAHYDRVIADGGVVPSGLSGVNAFYNAVKTIYGTTDITTAVSVGVDAQYLGYKLGAGAGATSGQAVQKLYSCAGSSGDVVQTTAASQPLLLAHSGANYYWNSGVNGNVIYSNNKLSLTSECDVKCKISNITNAGRFASQDGANRNFDFFFSNNTTGILSIRCNTSFATQVNSSVGLGLTSSYNGWVRFTYLSNGVNADVEFYTSTDGTTWTQLGTTQTIASTGLSFGTCVLGIGGLEAEGYGAILGKVERVLISSVIDGAAERDFNPASYNASTSQTQWTSTTGEVWTINTGTAATGYKGVLVDRTIVMADGVDDKLSSTYNRPDTLTQYSAFKINNSTKTGCLFGQNSSNGNTNNVFIDSAVYYYLNAAVSNVNRPLINNSLQIVTTVSNAGVENSIRLNNGTASTNAYTPTPSGNGVSIFARATDSFLTANINTYIVVVNADNSTVRTAMYNYIRSINNNAF
jgi:hypothetical protein